MSSITLASTWDPRGELSRLQRLLPRLEQVYAQRVIVLKPGVEAALAESLVQAGCRVYTPPEWSGGRLMALTQALETDATHIHYADMDRLLRWAETRPQEWQDALQALTQTDYLLMGRTAQAYATHPRALLDTERISNRVISHLIGRDVDVSAGSKGFSRRAAQFLAAHCQPGYALGTDGEWTVLLQRAGFEMQYVEYDGLDWESADRYQESAADEARQAQAAAAYDAAPEHWSRRVEVALEVVERGLAASEAMLAGSRENFCND